MRETLLNESLDPFKRLRAWIDRNAERGHANGFRNGCLIGNFTAEAAAHSPAMRKRLSAMIGEIQAAIAACLKAAVKTGDLPKGFDCAGTADFIFTVMQGATLGGRVVSRHIQARFGSHAPRGFLDCYGPSTREQWESFRVALTRLATSRENEDRIIAGAQECFRAFTRWLKH